MHTATEPLTFVKRNFKAFTVFEGVKLLGYVERTGSGWVAHRGSTARNRVQVEGVFTSREKAAEALRA